MEEGEEGQGKISG